MELEFSLEPRPILAQDQIERVTTPAQGGYARVVEIFERELGGYSRTIATTLVADSAPWPEAEQAFTLMAGAHGLMILAKTESGALTTLSGRPKRCTLYLVGNPLIANRLFDIEDDHHANHGQCAGTTGRHPGAGVGQDRNRRSASWGSV